jgi:hypothetical protein
MRRSKKVATVFTGAAALTGGYGPAALAATTPATAVRPAVAWQECGPNNGGISNWVHFFYPGDDHPAECFHGAGGSPVNATIASFCPGNNNGKLYTSVGSFSFNAGDGRHRMNYWLGSTYQVHVSGIYIFSWKGDSKCT